MTLALFAGNDWATALAVVGAIILAVSFGRLVRRRGAFGRFLADHRPALIHALIHPKRPTREHSCA